METGLGSGEDTILYYRSLTSVERWVSSQWTLRKSPVHLGSSGVGKGRGGGRGGVFLLIQIMPKEQSHDYYGTVNSGGE